MSEQPLIEELAQALFHMRQEQRATRARKGTYRYREWHELAPSPRSAYRQKARGIVAAVESVRGGWHVQ